jgi:hypothetical protein
MLRSYPVRTPTNFRASAEGIKAFAATVKEQALQIQNVSAELEVRKPVPQTVADSQ